MFRQHTFFRQAALYTLLLALCLSLLACSPLDSNGSEVHADGPEMPVGSASQATPTPVSPKPDRLLIPAIQLDASIEDVGITSSGDLATPALNPWVDTGWYADGPHPGEEGSAIIDGHLDRPGGYPAVFWLLRQIQVGNTVEVHENNGQMLRFRVTDVEYYAPQSAPLQQIFGNTNGKYLNLITCAGDWIPSQKQTTLRLVVYTKLISS